MDVTREITRRPGCDSDREFLYTLLRQSLGPHIEATYGAWNEAWQREHFLANSDPKSHDILEADGGPIGCLLLQDQADLLQLHRILVLPEHQNQGLGTRVMQELLSAASSKGKPTRLRVFRVSPAVRFYERLGFRRVGETETHILMEHAAQQGAAADGRPRGPSGAW